MKPKGFHCFVSAPSHRHDTALCCRVYTVQYVSMDRWRERKEENKKGERATGQTAFNSASWKQHSVPHLRHDPFSAPRGEREKEEGVSSDTGTIAEE